MRDQTDEPINDFQFFTSRFTLNNSTDTELDKVIDDFNKRGFRVLDYKTHTEVIQMQLFLIVVFRVKKVHVET
ncbi:hypothetical protein ACTWQB_09410 [Piscibacillus sp. B03]|uniref:hypothetical protein n=1 Tax=Piscibacillus sp. B03 TaxID=3457430 RepID=UPI003FCE180B